MASSSAAAARAPPPDPSAAEICSFLAGRWKRNLEWRHFGGRFQTLRMTNTAVAIDKYEAGSLARGECCLKWTFGKSFGEDDLRFGYVMKFTPESLADGKAQGADVYIEWQYNGETCSGVYQKATGVLVLNFFLKGSMVVITYRKVDENTMAVCIVECEEAHPPTIQTGSMCRLDANLYPASAPRGE